MVPMAERQTILLVDDEPRIADVVEYELEEHGFAVRLAADGDTGLELFRQEDPDLVLLDLGLPGLSGLELFQAMRAHRPRIPVIMLTCRSGEVDRVVGLEMGADDYVTKPFSPRELAARVKAVLRRAANSGGDPEGPLRQGPFTLDEEAFAITYFDRPLALTRSEFRLLAALLRHPARVFPRDVLMTHLYDDDHLVTDRTIDVYVKRLRGKCTAVRPGVDPIETVYGVGYKLHHPLEEAP